MIEVVTKNVAFTGAGEQGIRPSLNHTKSDEAQISLIAERAGTKPMPRRDHSATMIGNNKYLLIYGGKNDSAFQYEKEMGAVNTSPRSGIHSPETYRNSHQKTCLNDMMIFNFENFQWTAIAQHGFLPEARWSASLAYSSHSNQLFLFGGHGAQGACSNEVFSCELSGETVKRMEQEYRNH